MKDFKKLVIWEKAMDIAEKVYKISSLLPEEEKFGLVSQMRRSAVSIPSNIAEGSGRSSDKDKGRFMDISVGSSHELETQIILCEKLQFLTKENIQEVLNDLDELQKMMYKFRKVLKD